jgi:hypothetical protein
MLGGILAGTVGMIQFVVAFLIPFPPKLSAFQAWLPPIWIWFMVALCFLTYAQFRMWMDEHQGRAIDHTAATHHAEQRRIELESKERDWSNERAQYEHVRTSKNQEIEQLQSQLARPSIIVRFEEVPQRSPVFEDGGFKSFFRESEFLVRNGRFTVRGSFPTDIPSNQERRLEYRVSHEADGQTFGDIGYTHNLRPLLDEAFDLNDCGLRLEMLQIPVTVTYKDAIGCRFETELSLLHCPGMYGSPMMRIEASRRLQSEPARRNEQRSPESTTHEN